MDVLPKLKLSIIKKGTESLEEGGQGYNQSIKEGIPRIGSSDH